MPWEQKRLNPGCGPVQWASLCDLGQRPCPLWAKVAERTILLLSLSLEAPPFRPWPPSARGLQPSASLRCSRGHAAPTAGQAGGGSRQGGKRREGQELQEPAGAWAIAQLGSLARPASTGLHFHQPALPPSSALQTFLANLGCCSPGRGNCRRHSTRPPETLNPFRPSRRRLGAGAPSGVATGVPGLGVGWAGEWLAALAGPGLPTFINRLSPVMDSLSSRFQSPPWALDLGNQRGRSSRSPHLGEGGVK